MAKAMRAPDRRPIAPVAKRSDDALDRLTRAFQEADETAYAILAFFNSREGTA